MDTAMFFERIRVESVEQAPSREAHHDAPLTKDSNMLESFKDDTVELFVKKPAFGPWDCSGSRFPTANEIGLSARKATEILTKKSASSNFVILDPKSQSVVLKKQEPSESPNAEVMRTPVRRKQASIDIWKILTILNTSLLVELLALCLSR